MAGMPLAPSYLNNASLTLPFLNDHHSARVINENVEQMRAEVEWWRGGRVVPFHRQLLTRYQNSANMVIAVCTASYAVVAIATQQWLDLYRTLDSLASCGFTKSDKSLATASKLLGDLNT